MRETFAGGGKNHQRYNRLRRSFIRTILVIVGDSLCLSGVKTKVIIFLVILLGISFTFNCLAQKDSMQINPLFHVVDTFENGNVFKSYYYRTKVPDWFTEYKKFDFDPENYPEIFFFRFCLFTILP